MRTHTNVAAQVNGYSSSSQIHLPRCRNDDLPVGVRQLQDTDDALGQRVHLYVCFENSIIKPLLPAVYTHLGKNNII